MYAIRSYYVSKQEKLIGIERIESLEGDADEADEGLEGDEGEGAGEASSEET